MHDILFNKIYRIEIIIDRSPFPFKFLFSCTHQKRRQNEEITDNRCPCYNINSR